jgi:DNA-binding Xre family transcriptional regulator
MTVRRDSLPKREQAAIQNDRMVTYTRIMEHDRLVTSRERVIRGLMSRQQVSELELALAVGISTSTLQHKLAGGRLSVPELDRLARALGTRASDILALAELRADRMAS